jgi:hypothetical protein
MAPHLPPGEAEVLPKLASTLDSPHAPISPFSERAASGPHASDIAHSPFGLAPGLHGSQPAVDVLTCSHLEMERELVVDFIVDGRFPGPQVETSQTRHPEARYIVSALGGPQRSG